MPTGQNIKKLSVKRKSDNLLSDLHRYIRLRCRGRYVLRTLYAPSAREGGKYIATEQREVISHRAKRGISLLCFSSHKNSACKAEKTKLAEKFLPCKLLLFLTVFYKIRLSDLSLWHASLKVRLISVFTSIGRIF